MANRCMYCGANRDGPHFSHCPLWKRRWLKWMSGMESNHQITGFKGPPQLPVPQPDNGKE